MGGTLLAVATVPGGKRHRNKFPFHKLEVLARISGDKWSAQHYSPGAITVTASTLEAGRGRVALGCVRRTPGSSQ